ncbi:MAG TPA: MoxR family ATPase [Chloroflexia bacterium]|nr:MoxR family ATPase [Chloroflexia bacterium]
MSIAPEAINISAFAPAEAAPEVSRITRLAQSLNKNVSRVIVGKDDEIKLLLVAMLCEGHALLEDVPGIGKTTMAKALARSLGCTFHRIQFTPDLLPSDITGTSIYNQQTGQFETRRGPLFSQVVLADEINRAGPRTQSALLEAMEERQVTIDVDTMPLPRPFMVLATQNPIELEGTFPLPEAQLDRFIIKLSIGYPSEEDERAILRRFKEVSPLTDLQPVTSAEEVLQAQHAVRGVYVNPVVEAYMVSVVHATRRHEAIELGASPRATLALYRTSQALAATEGRGYVLPDDVKRMALPVLAHRIILSTRTRLRGRGNSALLQEVLDSVPVPVESVIGDDRR